MISADKRAAIYLLHKEGMGVREIARSLRVNRGTVSDIIKQKGVMPESARSDKIQLDAQLLIKLYKDCDGWVQRIHEKLTEEESIEIGYSTLTAAKSVNWVLANPPTNAAPGSPISSVKKCSMTRPHIK